MFKIDIEKIKDAVRILKMVESLIDEMKKEFNLADNNLSIIVKDNGELQIVVVKDNIKIMVIHHDGVSISTDVWLGIDDVKLIMKILEWLLSPY